MRGRPAEQPCLLTPLVDLPDAAVLPSLSRLRSRADFLAVTRGGRRAGSKTVLVHVNATAGSPRVGFVVNRGVGGAVIRNRVTRRLRHACLERLPQLRGDVVVRALPAAAAAKHCDLVNDLDSCLRRAGATASRSNAPATATSGGGG